MSLIPKILFRKKEKITMKKLALFLALLMLVSVFVGCQTDKPETTPKKTTPETPSTPAPDPQEEYIYLYFDDRKGMSEVFGEIVNEFEIVSQDVTSKVVGSNEKDENVVIFEEDTGRLIAVGTGTAVVKVNGEEKNIKVNPAPITLAVITGHSLGYGTKGNKTDSVLCKAGTAYNTSLMLKESTWRNSFKGSTLGYSENDRVTNIDCMTGDAGDVKGAQGVNSAIAYQWHQLTGEKMWVLNVAVGGSCVNQWQPDSVTSEWTAADAIEAVNMAAEILKNEVAAGHYEYRTTVMFNFSSTNFRYQNIVYDDAKLCEWHDGMWKGFQDGVTIDIDGDGKNDGPEYLGYIPAWCPAKVGGFVEDMELVYYRAASEDFPHVFLASDYTRHWLTDDAVKDNFPKINYKTQSGNALERPTKLDDIYNSDDQVHTKQVAYNAVGLQAAENLYNCLTGNAGEIEVELLEVSDGQMGIVVGDTFTMSAKKTYQFAIVSDPLGVNDYTIEVSKSLKLEGIFYVSPAALGSGKIIIKRGDTVVRTINVTITND